jgi:hypothetical protein
VNEYVRVTFPNAVGVKTPAGVTPVPDHVPPVGEKPVSVFAPDPLQILTLLPASTVGIGFTVIVLTSVLVQERASLTVTV